MSRRAWSLVAVCATLCSSFACESEVTFHLFTDDIVAAAGSRDAGEAGEADAAGAPTTEGGSDQGGGSGNSGSIAGEAGSAPDDACQKLGPEVCNGGDDDCNGAIDEGCAYTVLWTNEPDQNPIGSPTGGVMFLEPCPTGSVLTGLRVGAGGWIDWMSAVCRQIALHADTTQSPMRFSATLGPRLDFPTVPATPLDPSGKLQDFLCADGSILSGVDGTTTEDSGRHLLGLRLTCAPPIVSTSAGKTVFDYDSTQEATVGPFVCNTCSTTQAFNYTMKISAGHVASGLFGADGVWVDRVGFSESQATITPR
jgi:hypothetical protein